MRYRESVSAGLACSVVAGTVYIAALHEPGSLFYPFAAIAFLGGPAVAGLLAKRVIAAVIVFGAILALFIAVYVVWPQFQGTSIRLPAFCSDRPLTSLPAGVSYTTPDGRIGILLARGPSRAVVVAASDKAPYPSTVLLIDTSRRRVLQTLAFPNDVVMAAIANGIAYIYNDKLGYFIDARTGEDIPAGLLMDNYSGLSRTRHPVLMNQPGDAWYVQTNGTISSWGRDGSVRLRATMFFNAIALGCFVEGSTGRVLRL